MQFYRPDCPGGWLAMSSAMGKRLLLSAVGLVGIDRLFRRLNRRKLLVVMYHGVTSLCHEPPIWTQLPADRFRSQLAFLRDHYCPVSLGEVVTAFRTGSTLPDNAALVTFDDGLRNNFTVALPILQELAIPAAVFLTVDYIGTAEFLWVDELFLLLREGAACGVPLELPNPAAGALLRAGRLWEAYELMVEMLKRSGLDEREAALARLRRLVPIGRPADAEDFALLDWDQVRAMQQSGLVEFGVHTATHRILSELTPAEWEREIVHPRQTLERETGVEAATFCFPNGRPTVDFGPEHLDYLRRAGYVCAFTTENSLYDRAVGDPLAIGRIPAGNDATSTPEYFRASTAGVIHSLRTIRRSIGR